MVVEGMWVQVCLMREREDWTFSQNIFCCEIPKISSNHTITHYIIIIRTYLRLVPLKLVYTTVLHRFRTFV